MTSAELLVERSNISKTHFNDACAAATANLQPGEVRLSIERFAFTANNITYAAFGDAMKYWNFFPAKEGMGSVPVWGFATVSESMADGIKAGEKLYGYYPMSSHLIVSPAKLSPAGFFDSKAHRAELSPIYNYYTRTDIDPGYTADTEEIQMLFRPLFTTSFLIDDFLADNGFFDSIQIVLSSASSKTAYGLAFQLAKRENVTVVGLTSPSNAPFVESMDLYDVVIGYDKIDALNADIPTVFVDMAGNADVRANVHNHFTDNLKYSCSVGASHWDKMGDNSDLPGAKPTLFFAPAQAQKRSAELGSEGFQARVGEAWISFAGKAVDWVDVIEQNGENAITDVYRKTLEGTAKPREGYILGF